MERLKEGGCLVLIEYVGDCVADVKRSENGNPDVSKIGDRDLQERNAMAASRLI